MFIFLRLVLGHFIGDFLLQTNKIFELKRKGILGVLPHALLVMASFLLLSWPYLYNPKVWLFIIIISAIHLLQDSIKVGYAEIAKFSFWFYILDQGFHIALISTVFITELEFLQAPPAANILVALYNNNLLVLYLIGLIAATYNGFYLIRSFKLTFWGKARRYWRFEKLYGMFERTAIVTLCVVPGGWKYLAPLFLLRFVLFFRNKRRRFAHHSFIQPTEITLSWSIALTIGILLAQTKLPLIANQLFS